MVAPLGLVAVAGLMFGAGGGLIIAGPAVLLSGLLFWWMRGQRSVSVEVNWSGSAGVDEIALVQPRRGSVAASLARFEVRELVASPWFGIGIGFCLVQLVALGLIWENDNERGWWFFFGLAPMLAHPFAGMVVVASHRNRTRGRRDGCEELFGTCPADDGARSLGHLLTAWLPAVVSGGFVVVLARLIAAGNPSMFGPIDHEAAAAVVICSVLGAGAVALGVTLGRWAPWALSPFVAVVGVALAGGQINQIGLPSFSADRHLATFVSNAHVDMLFVARPVWAQAAWLGALGLLVASLALVPGTRRRSPCLVAVGAAALGLVAAVLVVRPVSPPEARRIAAMVLEPEAHQTCVAAGAELKVCAYRDYARVARAAAAEASPVADAVPAGVLRGSVLRQRPSYRTHDLQAEVAALVGDRRKPAPATELRLNFNSHPESLAAVRFRVAAHAVGLPSTVPHRGLPTVVAGQARGVIVLWLATRGLSNDEAQRLVRPSGREADPGMVGAIWPGMCHDEEGVLLWARQDLQAVDAMLAVPASRVALVIRSRWSSLIDPDTSVDELLGDLGLAPGGPADAVTPRPYSCDEG
ncbi:MAG: hypothetical protein ABIP03_10840 [Aquihabitans sp.]